MERKTLKLAPRMVRDQMKCVHPAGKDDGDLDEDFEKIKLSLGHLLPTGKGGRAGVGAHWEGTIFAGVQFAVNSAAGKYLQFIGGQTFNGWGAALATATEFSNLDVLYDEVFIKKVIVRYIPRNKYSAQSTASASAAGSPGDVNTLAATLIFLPHNANPYTDTANAWVNMMSQPQRKFFNLGDVMTFSAKNMERFDWKAPLMDQSTATAAMGWSQFSQVSTKYGGGFQLATPATSGASAAIGVLLENGIFGDAMLEYHIACRARG